MVTMPGQAAYVVGWIVAFVVLLAPSGQRGTRCLRGSAPRAELFSRGETGR